MILNAINPQTGATDWAVANDTVVDASDALLCWLHKPLADLLAWFKAQGIVWDEA